MAQTLAIAFQQRRSRPRREVEIRPPGGRRRDVGTGIRSGLARGAAQGRDIEDVLQREFQVKQQAIGASLSKFFGVPYEPFKADRIKPMDLLKNLKREYVEEQQWVPVEEGKEGIVILRWIPSR
jgi:hypothetical protein